MTPVAALRVSAARSRFVPRLVAILLILFGFAAPVVAGLRPGADPPVVVVVPIRGEIDLGVAPSLARSLRDASARGARAVILDIDTPGGRLDAVLRMRQSILDSSVRTIAFVNREAFSAGALVALAAEEIYMAPGSVLGAATPVMGGETASAKTVAAVRSTFRATAELRGRDPRIAEAMVDPDVVVEGLVERGQLLTLTSVQASERGYADGVVASRPALLAAAGLAGAVVEQSAVSPAERFVRFLTSPPVAALLVALGLVLLFADVLTGGFGLLGSVGLALLALFFWGHTLVGLAPWEGVTLVVAGVGLLALEMFVLPGLGVAGVLGAAALLGGLYLSLVGTGVVTSEDVTRAVSTLLGAAALAALSGLALLRLLPRAAAAQGLVLRSRVGQAEPRPPLSLPRGGRWRWIEGDRLEPQGTSNTYGVPDAEPASLQGAVGVAVTDLRPGGVALVQGQRVDVVTGGDYIMSGDPVVVVADEGYRRVVRRAESGAANLSDSGKE